MIVIGLEEKQHKNAHITDHLKKKQVVLQNIPLGEQLA